ncbi:MAG TPA: hypothetical protein VE173_10835, partial [Longimicrobiales bacterium]|nr:hypothetical protein [Longimicrobiales bacterium]
MGWFSALGLGGSLFPGVLWAKAQEAPEVTKEMVEEAEKVAGVEFTDEEREMMLRGLDDNLEAYRALREQSIPNSVPPAIRFEPDLPGTEASTVVRPFRPSREP